MDFHGFFLMFLAISQDFPHVSCFFWFPTPLKLKVEQVISAKKGAIKI
jgi:hypothetical protein